MANLITVREIPARNVIVTADETGIVLVNGIETSRPIADKALGHFVWVPAELSPNTKLVLKAEEIDAITAHSAPHIAKQREMARKARAWDNINNEGYSDGHNPHR